MLSGKLATVNLNGFVFFGSANSIGQKLQEVGVVMGVRVEVGLHLLVGGHATFDATCDATCLKLGAAIGLVAPFADASAAPVF